MDKQSFIKHLKRIFHICKYEHLDMYPPRPKYNELTYGFLKRCNCGKVKSVNLYDIKMVNEMYNPNIPCNLSELTGARSIDYE